MADYFVHFSGLLGVGISKTALAAHKSIGWTSTQEWLAAALRREDVDAFCNGASSVNR